jgi:hypothetical protein
MCVQCRLWQYRMLGLLHPQLLLLVVLLLLLLADLATSGRLLNPILLVLAPASLLTPSSLVSPCSLQVICHGKSCWCWCAGVIPVGAWIASVYVLFVHSFIAAPRCNQSKQAWQALEEFEAREALSVILR